VAQAERLALADVVDVGQVGQAPHLGQQLVLAGRFEGHFELDRAVEVVFEAALAPARDDEDVVDAGPHGLLDHVLDRRPVDDRQHLLGLGLRRRQEPRAEACRRDHRLAHHVRHSPVYLVSLRTRSPSRSSVRSSSLLEGLPPGSRWDHQTLVPVSASTC
jgi:hypothetical protein